MTVPSLLVVSLFVFLFLLLLLLLLRRVRLSVYAKNTVDRSFAEDSVNRTQKSNDINDG